MKYMRWDVYLHIYKCSSADSNSSIVNKTISLNKEVINFMAYG